MSARVVNRLAFSEFRHQIRSPLKMRRPKSPSAVAKARIKRDLFGSGDTREDSARFICRELTKQAEQASRKWGFDFTAGLPLSAQTQYIWERVPPTIAPDMYMCVSRAAHIREDVSLDDISDRLLDERAAAASRSRDSISNITASSSSSSTAVVTQVRITRSIQPKITDYLQERKRTSVTGVKRLSTCPPGKKIRRAVSMCETSTSIKDKKQL